MTPESAIYTVLKTAIEAISDEENCLKGSAIHPTVYSVIRKEKSVRIGNCRSLFAPQGDVIKELDSQIVLQILSKVEDKEKDDDYPTALNLVWEMSKEIVKILLSNSTLAGYGCDLEIQEGLRSWTNVAGSVYAVQLLPITINPTNQ